MRNLKNIRCILCILVIISYFFSACEVKDFTENGQILVDGKTIESNNLSGKPSKVAFDHTGPVGGGFPNVVTWDPDDNYEDRVYYGSDIGGTGFSTDGGKTFQSAAQGLGYRDSHQKIAALNAITNDNNQTVIVGGTGFQGGQGGVISSTDHGLTWNEDSNLDGHSFSAQNSKNPLPGGRPRSTDSSLIQYAGGTTWVAGTYSAGIYISKNNRNSWQKITFADGKLSGDIYVRSMAISPSGNTVYVGLWGESNNNDWPVSRKGLWKITNLNANNPTAKRIVSSPPVIESIVVLGNRAYVACGLDGVYKLNRSTDNLTKLTSLPSNGEMYTAIHGFNGTTNNNNKIVVGTASPEPQQTGSGRIYLSTNSGNTWDNTTDNGSVSNTPWGGTSELLVFQNHSNWALGKKACDVASIQVSPHNSSKWVVCATSAIWTTDDNGAKWKPANGFQILTYRDVEINSNGYIAAGNIDHDVLLSTDGGDNWTDLGIDKTTSGHGIAFSPNGNQLAFASNERDKNDEDANFGIASNLAGIPTVSDKGAPSHPQRIIGVSWVKNDNNDDRIIAAVDEGGIWTMDKTQSWGSWEPHSNFYNTKQSNSGLRCSMVNNGAEVIFIYDRNDGVLRSKNYGVSWKKIYDGAVGKDKGYLAYDDTNDILYVSTNSNVFRMNNATNSTPPQPQSLNYPGGKPGAMALDSQGGLVVYGKPLISHTDARLFRNPNPKNNNFAWDDLANWKFKRIAPPVTDLDIKGNTIVLVTSGKGILVSTNY